MAAKKTASALKDEAEAKPFEGNFTGALETFIPASSFTGYVEPYESHPAGVTFTAGVESVPVPKDFIDLMREKNLVADK